MLLFWIKLEENECQPKDAKSQPVDTECQLFEKSHSKGQPGCDSETIKLSFRSKAVDFQGEISCKNWPIICIY